ncbi:MAG TPA: glycosyltransferase [Rhizomicrobium sp.]|nr:glycosyltransferase [Rhizomicrobium sp.]
MTLALAFLPVLAWLYLVFGRGWFWLTRERDDGAEPEPQAWPSVVAVVPARNEADVVARSVSSLLAQDYRGSFRVVLVDDQSDDGTAEAAPSDSRLEIVAGSARAPGWTGKLWAVKQGAERAAGADYLWLTDADIAHAPNNLRNLVARAETGGLVLTSLMAKLHCESFAERLLIPAFVFFFDMLYPFAWVNDPRRTAAAAAGGCMLIRREALERAGGIDAIHGEIIDDCAMGRLMKRQGPIWLGLTERCVSLRPYSFGDIARMVARSAYAQLSYSPLRLAATVAGMLLVYAAAPLLAVFARGPAQAAGAAAWALMAAAFAPMLRFYRLAPLWGAAMPFIGALYGAFTLASALEHWRGRGGMWKGRAQAMGRA